MSSHPTHGKNSFQSFQLLFFLVRFRHTANTSYILFTLIHSGPTIRYPFCFSLGSVFLLPMSWTSRYLHWMKLSLFIKNFHQKPLSSKPFSSETIFIRNHSFGFQQACTWSIHVTFCYCDSPTIFHVLPSSSARGLAVCSQQISNSPSILGIHPSF